MLGLSVRSFVTTCLAGALLVAASSAQNNGSTPAGPTAEPSVFVHRFGEPGSRGSMRVEFNDRGAGVRFVQLCDHYVTTEAANRATHDDGDYLLLALAGGGDYAFRVAEVSAGNLLFDGDLGVAAWQREDTADGVHFSIESQKGLVLHKTFRHRGDLRSLDLELRVENRGYTGGGMLDLRLVGPMLLDQGGVFLVGRTAYAIAGPAGDGDWNHLTASADSVQDLLVLGGQELAMAGTTNRFFGGFVWPHDAGAKTVVQKVAVSAQPPVDIHEFDIKARSLPRLEFYLRLPIPAQRESSAATFGVYLGPKSYRVFAESPEHARFLPVMDVDLNAPCCGSVTIPGGRFMASLLLRLLGWFHDLFNVWALAIMALTVLVRACLAPLNFRMQKSMRAYGQRMAVLKPKLDKIKEQHKDSPEAFRQAMLEFQREHKMLPPIGGCLPIFLTMPIYLGLFTALRTAYDLRQQSFLYIPDLSLPDRLATLSFWPHNFNLLPLVWIGMMIVLQLRMPLPTDPQQREIQRMMRFMPLLFGVMLYNYAAGLMVYMVTSMTWTFIESAITKKILGPINPEAAGMTPAPMM